MVVADAAREVAVEVAEVVAWLAITVAKLAILRGIAGKGSTSLISTMAFS